MRLSQLWQGLNSQMERLFQWISLVMAVPALAISFFDPLAERIERSSPEPP